MVVGLDKFEEHFKEFSDCFVIIGGTACSILFREKDLQFRSTKDIDVVLILDEINGDFSKVFWEFIELGEYSSMEGDVDKISYYRFLEPKKTDFPFMIELFSRKPDISGLLQDQRIVPIKFEEAKSLSAILLNDDYFGCLRDGIRAIENLNYLDTAFVILFKMKAYLDLVDKKQHGEKIDSKDIKKHKNDVFKLLQIVGRDERVKIPASVHSDVQEFQEKVQIDRPDLKALKIELTFDDAIKIIGEIFEAENEKEA